ncbi:MAG: fumarylacetoacetate hydrolase family protein [Hyphomicrobiaceae bacterium]
MAYVFDPKPVATLPIAGSDTLYPVHRVYCVGRNYAEHAREMGSDPDKEPPFFFSKSPDNIVTDGKFPYPPATKDVHYEMELVVVLKSGGTDIKPADALQHVYGYAVGLDMTRRDLQNAAKKMGRPWEIGKMVEKSAPCTAIVPAAKIGHPAKGKIWLDVNGQRKQDADISDMIWDVPNQIAFLSQLWTLEAGDVIMTGTPAGVGSCQKGDVLKGGVDGVAEIEVKIV